MRVLCLRAGARPQSLLHLQRPERCLALNRHLLTDEMTDDGMADETRQPQRQTEASAAGTRRAVGEASGRLLGSLREGAEAGGEAQAGRRQGVCGGLQKAQLQTQTRDANGRAGGATVGQSKASQPRAGPVPCDARAAEGLPPPALPPLQSLTGRVLHEKGLGGDGGGGW